MLTEKQQLEFYERYKSIYGDTSEATGTWELPHIKKEEEEEHIRMRNDKLTEIIWPRKSKRIYKIRPYWPETVLHKVFSCLWLCYGPVVDRQ